MLPPAHPRAAKRRTSFTSALLAMACWSCDPTQPQLVAASKAAVSAASSATERAHEQHRHERAKRDADQRMTAEREAAELASNPLWLSDVVVRHTAGPDSAFEVVANAKVNKEIDPGLIVRAKILCEDGGRFAAQVFALHTSYTTPLDRLERGETVSIRGTAFAASSIRPQGPCQLNFKLSGASATLAVDLYTACYAGNKTTRGVCEPALVAPAMSGAAASLGASDLAMSPTGSYGPSQPLGATYTLRFNADSDDDLHVTFKATCHTDGDRRYVDLANVHVSATPFRFRAGESLLRSASLFYNPSFRFVAPAKLCDLTVSLRTPKKAGSYGPTIATHIAQGCYKAPRVTKGTCAAPASVQPRGPLTADSLAIDNVRIAIVEPYGSAGSRYQLSVEADATVQHPLEFGPSITANVECELARTTQTETSHLYGVELHYLDGGETARVSATAFVGSPLHTRPKACSVSFSAGVRFRPEGGTTGLGSWCLQKGKLKPGDCRGRDKPRRKD